MYLFLRLMFGISVACPVLFWILGNNSWVSQFPIFVSVFVHTTVGLGVFLFSGGQSKQAVSTLTGMSLILLGHTGVMYSGKTLWLPIFWELSTLGGFLTYFSGDFNRVHLRSLIALLGGSGVSAVFLAAWVFLPADSVIGQAFLLVGLLVKSAFSSSHFWYPEFHSGAKTEVSALYSGAISILPPLFFLQYFVPNVGIETSSKILVPLAGLGVFLGGVSAFYSKEIRRILAYSSIETLNFLWLCLFLYVHWINSAEEEMRGMASMFQVLFYLALLHHSFSKSFQILSFGYLLESTGLAHIDHAKGIGRISRLSPMLLGLGTFSYLLIPGSFGFLSESTYLFIISKVVDLPSGNVFILSPALIIIVMGLVLGSAAHLRLFLTTHLSIPTERVNAKWEERFSEKNVHYSLVFLGLMIFVLPLVILLAFVYGQLLPPDVSGLLHVWFGKILIVSGLTSLMYLLFILLRKPHKIQKRRTWDCGSDYSGEELSIPGSTFSDPVHYSMGVLSDKETGYSVVDKWMESQIFRVLDMGRLWIKDVEKGSLSNYIAFSAFGLLISIVIIVIIRFNQDFYANF